MTFVLLVLKELFLGSIRPPDVTDPQGEQYKHRPEECHALTLQSESQNCPEFFHIEPNNWRCPASPQMKKHERQPRQDNRKQCSSAGRPIPAFALQFRAELLGGEWGPSGLPSGSCGLQPQTPGPPVPQANKGAVELPLALGAKAQSLQCASRPDIAKSIHSRLLKATSWFTCEGNSS